MRRRKRSTPSKPSTKGAEVRWEGFGGTKAIKLWNTTGQLVAAIPWLWAEQSGIASLSQLEVVDLMFDEDEAPLCWVKKAAFDVSCTSALLRGASSVLVSGGSTLFFIFLLFLGGSSSVSVSGGSTFSFFLGPSPSLSEGGLAVRMIGRPFIFCLWISCRSLKMILRGEFRLKKVLQLPSQTGCPRSSKSRASFSAARRRSFPRNDPRFQTV